jgi:hypothetical protein
MTDRGSRNQLAVGAVDMPFDLSIGQRCRQGHDRPAWARHYRHHREPVSARLAGNGPGRSRAGGRHHRRLTTYLRPARLSEFVHLLAVIQPAREVGISRPAEHGDREDQKRGPRWSHGEGRHACDVDQTSSLPEPFHGCPVPTSLGRVHSKLSWSPAGAGSARMGS